MKNCNSLLKTFSLARLVGNEPRRVFRRLSYLSPTTMAGAS